MKKLGHIDSVKILHFLINKKVYNDFMDFVGVQNINFGIRWVGKGQTSTIKRLQRRHFKHYPCARANDQRLVLPTAS